MTGRLTTYCWYLDNFGIPPRLAAEMAGSSWPAICRLMRWNERKSTI